MSSSDEHPLDPLVGPKLLKKIGPQSQKKANLRNFRTSFHDGPTIQTREAMIGKDLVLLYFSAVSLLNFF